MIVIVCGGRDFEDRAAVFAALDRLHARQPLTRLVHGGARGADALAASWARERGVATCTFEAHWQEDGAAASPARNERMAGVGAELCVVFPGGTGTEDMASRAANRGIAVWRPCG